jgi:hypothetical protein
MAGLAEYPQVPRPAPTAETQVTASPVSSRALMIEQQDVAEPSSKLRFAASTVVKRPGAFVPEAEMRGAFELYYAAEGQRRATLRHSAEP